MKSLLVAALLLGIVNRISTKLLVDVYQEVANDDDSVMSCPTQLETCTAKVKECTRSVGVLTEGWLAKQTLQERALNDLTYKIKRSREPEPRTFASCDEALNSTKESGGVFRLNMTSSNRLPPFEVYCLRDANDGSAWMLIQRRVSGEVDFYRGWFDYRKGFGDTNGSYWLGLERMHAITSSEPYELWIHLEDFEGQKRFAKYSNFEVGDRRSNYMLKILGQYSGDAGDSMVLHMGQGFSTKDSDNSKLAADTYNVENCAVSAAGAWWYNNCFQSNLNGLYLMGWAGDTGLIQGIEWNTWRSRYSLKAVHMAIRKIPE